MGIRSLAAELLPAALHGLQRASFSPHAEASAEAASFAELTDKLAYLSKADLKLVREAYKFADEAHLGQFRASGLPYITHPVAVAGLCADWKLDAQAIMAALMHDTIEDQGVTKVELIERFGAPDRRPRRRPDQARPAALQHARGKPGRVVPQDAAGDGARRARDPDQARRPAAQHAHDERDGERQAPTHRARDARHLRPDRAPAGPEPDLSRTAGAVLRAPVPVAPCRAGQGRAARARAPARHRRARAAGRRARVRGTEDQGPGQRAREDRLFDLPQDARQARRLRAGQRHLRLPHRRRLARRVLPGAGRAAPALQAGAGPLQGLHRDPEGERLPVAAHHARQPAGHRGRVPDAHRGDARGGRERHRRALAVQGRRQERRRRRMRSAWARCGCKACSTSRTRPAMRPSSWSTSRSTSTRTRSTSSRRAARSWRCRAARRRWISPMRSTATSATTWSRPRSTASRSRCAPSCTAATSWRCSPHPARGPTRAG